MAIMREGASVAGNRLHLLRMVPGPVRKSIFIEQVQVFGDLRLPQHLFVLLLAGSHHPGNQGRGRREVIGCQRQSLRVEIIDGQVAVRLNDDWFRAGFNRLRIDAVRQSLLNDDGVGEIAFGLTQEIADVDGFAGAAHAEQHGMLRGAVAFAAGDGR